MNIFLREMKAHLRSLIIWAVSAFLLVAAGMSKFEGMASTGGDINAFLSAMPEAVKAIFGLSNCNLSSAVDFYGVMFLYVMLLAGTHAVMLGAGIVAKEERDRTVEFLMVKPVTRAEVLTSKLTAALANVVLLNLAAYAAGALFVGYYSHWEADQVVIAKLTAALLLFQLVYLALGFMLAAASKNVRGSAAAGAGILIGTFILSVIIDLYDKLDPLKYLTPFKYFGAQGIIKNGAADAVFIVLALVLSALMAALGYVKYQKRDLKI